MPTVNSHAAETLRSFDVTFRKYTPVIAESLRPANEKLEAQLTDEKFTKLMPLYDGVAVTFVGGSPAW